MQIVSNGDILHGDNLHEMSKPIFWGFDISCKLSPKETVYMKCQNLFSGKNKKNIISVLSAGELVLRAVKVNSISRYSTNVSYFKLNEKSWLIIFQILMKETADLLESLSSLEEKRIIDLQAAVNVLIP